MKASLHAPPQAAPTSSFTPVRCGTLQRKCACGGTPGPTGECAECRRQRGLSLAPGQGLPASRSRPISFHKVDVRLKPHSATDAQLKAMATVYERGRTPVLAPNGSVRALDMQPANVSETAKHLDTIQRTFGSPGLARTIRGLAVTRGAHFVASALGKAAPAIARKGSAMRAANVGTDEEGGTLFGQSMGHTEGGSLIASQAARLLARAGSGKPLPPSERAHLSTIAGEELDDVRIHNDETAHKAAAMLGARAFAVGRSIFFGANEYRPSSQEGKHVLAHEVAHTVQQKKATVPSWKNLQIGRASSVHEAEADRFARSATGLSVPSQPVSFAHTPMVARVQRAISFSRTNDSFTTNTMGVTERAGGFQIRPTATPLFQWTADVQINGNAGDPCGSFEVGPHQVVRTYWHNVWWGTGGNRTHRKCKLSALPIRDATAAGNTWYHDPLARAFAGCGDSQNTGLNDSPRSQQHPWANPVAGRAGTRGWFNYGVGFVAYISARDTRLGTGANAFRALGSVYWNTMIEGSFDTAQPVGSRVSATGGALNRGGVIEGGSAEFPSMHGGAIANTSHSCTDT